MGKLAAQHGESGSKEKRIGWVEVLGFYLWKLIALIVESNHIKRIKHIKQINHRKHVNASKASMGASKVFT